MSSFATVTSIDYVDGEGRTVTKRINITRAGKVNIEHTINVPYKLGKFGGELGQLMSFTPILKNEEYQIGFGDCLNAVIVNKLVMYSHIMLDYYRLNEFVSSFSDLPEEFNALSFDDTLTTFIPLLGFAKHDAYVVERYTDGGVDSYGRLQCAMERNNWVGYPETELETQYDTIGPPYGDVQSFKGTYTYRGNARYNDSMHIWFTDYYADAEHSGILVYSVQQMEELYGDSKQWYIYHGYEFFPYGAIRAHITFQGALTNMVTLTPRYTDSYWSSDGVWLAFASDNECLYAYAATTLWAAQDIKEIMKYNSGF